MSDEIRINGNQISWSSVRLKIEGVPYTGVTAIEYGDARERSYGYGMGRHHAPRGRSVGKYTPDPVVMTCYTSTAKAIREDLASRAEPGRGLGSVSSTIVVQYIEPDDDTVTVELEDCVLVKEENSEEEGPDALSVKLTFSTMGIRRDGRTMYDEAGA